MLVAGAGLIGAYRPIAIGVLIGGRFLPAVLLSTYQRTTRRLS